jgi:hypothetical protein
MSEFCHQTRGVHPAHRWVLVYRAVKFYCDTGGQNATPPDCLRLVCDAKRGIPHPPHIHVFTPTTTRHCPGKPTND